MIRSDAPVAVSVGIAHQEDAAERAELLKRWVHSKSWKTLLPSGQAVAGVLFALAVRVQGPTGAVLTAWASRTTLADLSGKSPTQVGQGVKNLAEAGLIRVIDSKGGNALATTQFQLLPLATQLPIPLPRRMADGGRPTDGVAAGVRLAAGVRPADGVKGSVPHRPTDGVRLADGVGSRLGRFGIGSAPSPSEMNSDDVVDGLNSEQAERQEQGAGAGGDADGRELEIRELETKVRLLLKAEGSGDTTLRPWAENLCRGRRVQEVVRAVRNANHTRDRGKIRSSWRSLVEHGIVHGHSLCEAVRMADLKAVRATLNWYDQRFWADADEVVPEVAAARMNNTPAKLAAALLNFVGGGWLTTPNPVQAAERIRAAVAGAVRKSLAAQGLGTDEDSGRASIGGGA